MTLPDNAASPLDIGLDNGRNSIKRVPSFILAILSGGLLTLAFPHTDVGWFAFIGLAPFLTTFPYSRTRAAFFHGFLCGFVYFTTLLYWIAVFSATKIGIYGIGAWLILSSRESLYVGLFAAALNFLWPRLGWVTRAIAAACLWTFVEWLRQLGTLGFGWGDLGYSQWRFLPLIQVASVTGTWGVSWIIVFVNAAIASGRPKIITCAACILLLVSIAGAARMALTRPTGTVPASALQANINEDVPYQGNRPADTGYFYGTLNTFDQMTGDAERRGSTICVTAETSIPGYPGLDIPLRLMLGAIARKHNETLIVGARDTNLKINQDTNSVFIFHPDGSMSGPYNKQQLVPFGEYVPLRSTFPFLNAFHVLDYDMAAGASNQAPLDAGGRVKAGVAICYESTYPRFLRQQVADGATFDVVVTDDTWYGRTAAAQQHLAMSILRAVETDRYLVRCASTGISAIISPNGMVLTSAGIFTKATVTAPIEQRFDKTPFVRFGDWFVYLCIGGIIVIFILTKDGTRKVD